MNAKLKLSVTVLLAAAAAAGLLVQRHSQAMLRGEILSLREQLARLQAENQNLCDRLGQARSVPEPRLPAPPLQTAAQTPGSTEDSHGTNFFARFIKDPPKLTSEQVAAYLKARSAHCFDADAREMAG